mmetsp:Transcript_17012/g.52735  ORF Transcript_17012/g.52735 Transcript_17012/m.52735 type:complete len:219 (-) Transcript_17012:940-1596(-)
MPRSMILSTTEALSLASSSLAAVNHIAGSVGMVSRALLSTFLALRYVSSRASASHSSTCCGQHSTAWLSITRASSSDSRLTASFHSRTLEGTCSSARRSTRRLASASSSSSAARSHNLTLPVMARTPAASTPLAASPACRRLASSHTSSEPGHSSQPRWMMARAEVILPATSSSRAAAIHPGACFGLVAVTLFSSTRAFLMSDTSASEVMRIDERPVR